MESVFGRSAAEATLDSPFRFSPAAEPLFCRDWETDCRVSPIQDGTIGMCESRAKPPLKVRVSTLKGRLLRGTESQPRTSSYGRLFEPAVALGLTCSLACNSVKSVCLEEKDRAAIATVAAAASFGLFLSVSCPAIADTSTMGESRVSFVESGNITDDVEVQLSPEQRLSLNAELQTLGMTQNGLISEQAGSSVKQKGKDGLNMMADSHGLIVREDESGMIVLSTDAKAPSLKGFREVPDRPSQDGIVGAATTTAGVIPASCASSDLLAVAAVGSVASAASVAGNALTQSSGSLQPAVAVPGAQLLARVLQHLEGGGVAGAVGASVVYPLDTIKSRMQAQSSKDGEKPQYKDEFDCFRQLLQEGGPSSLYSGLVPQLLGIAPEKALKLTVNEVLLEMLEQLLPGARLWALEIIAGGGGGFSQILVTNPMEIVKLRLQIQSKLVSPKGLWQVVKELGLQGLYSGSGITLIRDVPSSSIFFASYALLSQLYPEQRFWAGFLAAIPATILVTPFDVIKTRLQMETPAGEEPYRSAWHCFSVLLQREGPRGLFKGGLMRVLRTSPQFGITLMLYSLFCDGS